MSTGQLAPRLAVAAVGVPIIALVLRTGGWVLALPLSAVAGIAAWEFYRLAEGRGVRPFVVIGVPASAALALIPTWLTSTRAAPATLVVVVSVLLLCFALAVWWRTPDDKPLSSVSATVAGVIYTGGTLAFVPLLRELSGAVPVGFSLGSWHAAGFVFLPLTATWVGDTAAYFAGRAWGRRKLVPAVSPSKTVVGAFAGLIGAAAGAVVVSMVWLSDDPVLPVGIGLALGMGLLLGLVGQVGDLAESVLKREAGVKDSGSWLPGHGGFLDRLDSLFFAFPVAWGMLTVLGTVR